MMTKKHIIGFILLVTGVICTLNASVFGGIVPMATSYEQLTQQTISASTGYTCILHGLSPFLYSSHFAVPRRQIRYVLISMLIFLILANFIGLITVIKSHYLDNIEEALEVSDLFTPFEQTCRTLTLVFFVLTIILLIIALVLVIWLALAIHNYPDHTQEPSNISLP